MLEVLSCSLLSCWDSYIKIYHVFTRNQALTALGFINHFH